MNAIETKLSLKSTSDEAKKLLSSYTEEALGEGIFGVPYYVGKCGNSL